jgi:hypothetical protein
MTFKSTMPLDSGGNFFDSMETDILSTAFEKAWAFVELDPMLGVLGASERQSQLARCPLRGSVRPGPRARDALIPRAKLRLSNDLRADWEFFHTVGDTRSQLHYRLAQFTVFRYVVLNATEISL